MLCCWEKTVEKKTITKPLLAESKSSTGESKPSTGEPKVAERKLTGFEPPLTSKPEHPSAPIAVKAEPVFIKQEPKPEPKAELVVIKSDPEPVKPLPPKPSGPKPDIAPIPIPQKSVIETTTIVQEQNPATFVEKNDLVRNEKKNRSKSNKR